MIVTLVCSWKGPCFERPFVWDCQRLQRLVLSGCDWHCRLLMGYCLVFMVKADIMGGGLGLHWHATYITSILEELTDRQSAVGLHSSSKSLKSRMIQLRLSSLPWWSFVTHWRKMCTNTHSCYALNVQYYTTFKKTNAFHSTKLCYITYVVYFLVK